MINNLENAINTNYTYTRVPDAINYGDKGILSDLTRRVYIHIYKFWLWNTEKYGKDAYFVCSQQTIANSLQCSIKTITRAIKKLVNLELVSTESLCSGGVLKYRILDITKSKFIQYVPERFRGIINNNVITNNSSTIEQQIEKTKSNIMLQNNITDEMKEISNALNITEKKTSILFELCKQKNIPELEIPNYILNLYHRAKNSAIGTISNLYGYLKTCIKNDNSKSNKIKENSSEEILNICDDNRSAYYMIKEKFPTVQLSIKQVNAICIKYNKELIETKLTYSSPITFFTRTLNNIVSKGTKVQNMYTYLMGTISKIKAKKVEENSKDNKKSISTNSYNQNNFNSENQYNYDYENYRPSTLESLIHIRDLCRQASMGNNTKLENESSTTTNTALATDDKTLSKTNNDEIKNTNSNINAHMTSSTSIHDNSQQLDKNSSEDDRLNSRINPNIRTVESLVDFSDADEEEYNFFERNSYNEYEYESPFEESDLLLEELPF